MQSNMKSFRVLVKGMQYKRIWYIDIPYVQYVALAHINEILVNLWGCSDQKPAT